MRKPKLYTTFLLFLLASCDCLQKASGKVIDAGTGLPMDSVWIGKKHYEDHVELTDSAGNFTIKAISGGLCRCPPMQVVITKTGYIRKVEKIKNGAHKEITLEKRKK